VRELIRFDRCERASETYFEEVKVRHGVLLESRQVGCRRRYPTAREVIRGVRVALVLRRLRRRWEEMITDQSDLRVSGNAESAIGHAHAFIPRKTVFSLGI